jgi:hypothetical protein
MMNRFFALLLALTFASVTVSSACTAAADDDWIHFTLEPSQNGEGKIQARFRNGELGHRDSDWSAGFMPSDLIGLDLAGFRRPGSQSLRFALVREAGRLDCAGNGGGSLASGNCRFTPDAAFTQMLVSRGVGRPTKRQALGLMALNARREILDAVATAHYPTPTIDDLMALTAVGVTGPYISQMAQAGYRPKSIKALIEFKALNITPQWIGGFVRAGYANLPGDELVQLKAMNITPDYISGFERAGYRKLPVDTLVQLKALNITPDFVRWASAGRSTMPPINALVEMKIFGRKR